MVARKRQDDVDNVHDHGFYSPTRTIFITGEVNEDMYKSVVKNLLILDSSNSTSAINIVINSQGGDLNQCKAIFDAIKACKNYVRGFVVGEAYSSASLILQACDERLMLPNSQIMIHAGEHELGGHPSNVKRWQKMFEQDAIWMENVYFEKMHNKNTRFTKERLKEMLKFDTILTASKSIEFGLADKVIENFDYY